MRQKNPIVSKYLSYLQIVTPHRIWYYGLMLIALSVASSIFMRKFDEWTVDSIQMMAFTILSIYWFFQFQVARSTVCLAQFNCKSDLREESVSTLTHQSVILRKVLAIIWYYRYIIILLTVVLLGLSLAIAGYLNYPNYFIGRGLLQHVGVPTTAAGYSPHRNYRLTSHLFYSVCMGLSLLLLTISNTLLTISIGLWSKSRTRTLKFRFLLMCLAIVIFLGLYELRTISPLDCDRHSMGTCERGLQGLLVYSGQLVIDSNQSIVLSFIDGGATMVTGIYDWYGVGLNQKIHIHGYQIRHLFVIVSTVIYQITISWYLLKLNILSLDRVSGE